MQDKFVGLLLAAASSIGIGSSYVITKIGLRDASERHGFDGDGHQYLMNPIWWAGMVALVIGEAANFAAYAFAPAILVTPLGALSVLTGAVLGAYFLGERLGVLGRLGCAICLIGSVVIVSHAPPDQPIETVDEILHYAIQPAFLIFCSIVAVFSFIMIYKVCPKYGTKNPIYYLSVCAATGSVSVMAIKAFGIALKLTANGKNQFTHPSTYAFAIVIVVCILTQMNYLNKALNAFSQSIVSPVYYVTFTVSVLTASFILFQGFNTTSSVNTISLLCGFLIIFSGVYLLNLADKDPDGHKLLHGRIESGGIPTDAIAGLQTRLSMQSQRRSQDPRRGSQGSIKFSSPATPRDRLMHSFDVENGGFALSDLQEENDSEDGMDGPDRPLQGNAKAVINGNGKTAMNGNARI
ncbi:MAG: hypothetical protein MMC33_005933 [Icmadophila ericetorum]|nr:hypothetical protein [Icmadophila ericetorum]